MATWVQLGVSNAVAAAILAVLALAASRWCRRPALVHSLWLLALLKLVTPPLFPLPLRWLPAAPAVAPTPAIHPQPVLLASFVQERSPVVGSEKGGERVRAHRQLSQQPNAALTVKSGAMRPVGVTNQALAPEAVGTVSFHPAAPPPATAVIPDESQVFDTPDARGTCLRVLGALWLMGAVTCLAWAIINVLRFERLLRCARRAPAELQAQAEALARGMGLARCPAVWLLPGPLPPLVWAALGRARIFFPAGLLARLDAEGRAALLAHELAHVRRRDHWVRWLEMAAICLYWWYPVAWLARRRLHEAEEECCDAWAVGEVPAHAYAGAILEAVDFLSQAPTAPALASGLDRTGLLKRRLTLIMCEETPKRLSLLGGLIVLLVALLLLPLVPTLARSEKEPAKAPPPAQPAGKAARPAEDDEPETFGPNSMNLIGGTRGFWSVAVTPNGRWLVAGGGRWDTPGDVRVWDLASGKPRFTFREAQGVASVAISPDGRLLAYASWARVGRVRELATGKQLAELALDSVARVAFAPDSKTLATATEKHTVQLWEPRTGRELAKLAGDLTRFHCVAFSPDGKRLAAGGGDWDRANASHVAVWDVASRKQVMKLAHERPVLAVAFTPDGSMIASGGVAGAVKVWDSASGRIRFRMAGPANWVEGLAFSPDGTLLAGDSAGGAIRLWDTATGREVRRFNGHTDKVKGIAFVPGSKVLVTSSSDRTVRLWNVSDGTEVRTFRRDEEGVGDPTGILAVAYAPDGKTVALGMDDGTVHLRSVGQPGLVVLKGHKDPVKCVAFSPDGKTLASGSPDNTVRLWDVASGKEKTVLEGHTSWVYAVAFAPDGKTLASAGYDKVGRLWDPASGKERGKLTGHKASIRSVAFAPDGKSLVTGSGDRTVRLWDLGTGKELAVLRGHTATVRAVALSPDGKTLASAGEDGIVKLWDAQGQKERAELKGHVREVAALAFSPKGKTLATGGADGTVRLWDPATGKARGLLRGHSDVVTGLAFAPGARNLVSVSQDKTIKVWPAATPPLRPTASLSAHAGWGWSVAVAPDGRTLASVSGFDKSGQLKLWNLATRETRVTIDEPKGLRCLAYVPDGKWLITGSFDNTAQVRDAATGKIRRVLRGHKGGVNSVAVSGDGKTLATGSLDRTTKLWDLATGRELATLAGHTDWVLAVAFAPDGKTVASAGKDGMVKLWDAATGMEQRTLRGHSEGVEAVAFSPDGKTLATGSWDQSVRLWDSATGRPLRRFQGRQFGFLCLAFSPDSKTLAAANGHWRDHSPGEIRLWNVVNGTEQATLRGHATGIRGVTWSPDGKTLASMDDKGVLKLWSAPRKGAPAGR